MTRPTYIVDATRAAGGWVLCCREHPAARVEVPRLLDGAAAMRSMIAAMAKIAEGSFDIEVHTLRSSNAPDHGDRIPRRRLWRS